MNAVRQGREHFSSVGAVPMEAYYVYADIARYGLGNKLIVWARAEIFAKEHGLPMLCPHLTQLPSVGALLRGEGLGRMNLGSFAYRRAAYIRGLKKFFVRRMMRVVDESGFVKTSGSCIVRIGLGEDSFAWILRHQEYVMRRLQIITNCRILKSVEEIAAKPFIGVHVRRGDFKAVGISICDDWYVRAIARGVEEWRRTHPEINPLIRVFSDGKPKEVDFIEKSFPWCRVIIMPKDKPIHDIWALSKSAILVGSSGSTFSMWAVLLGQMPSIWSAQKAPVSRELYVNSAMDPIIV